VFVGWGAVLLGIFIERFQRNGVGAAMASLVGFATLIIAHHLAMGGDTLEMMRAVLDSNFWLGHPRHYHHLRLLSDVFSGCARPSFL
jgi:hypothetical protein